MSERYIFNKKLNRTQRPWYWLVFLCASFFTYKVLAQPAPLVNPNAKAEQRTHSELQNIEFQRTSSGGARVVFTFSNDQFTPEFTEQPNQLNMALDKVKLAEEQHVSLDVIDFATPVTQVETFDDIHASRVQFTLTDEVNWQQQVRNNTLAVVIEKRTAEQKAAEHVSAFDGAPIELDFQDIPVRQVLQIIAKVNGFNLVTTDTVSGNVTLNLSGVPWDQALDMILKVKGLDKRMEGNILLVAPSEELAARETQQLQSRQQVAELAPLMSENIQINYAKAVDMANILKSGTNSILSPRGTASVDERTNTLLIRDTQDSILEARQLIEALDIPVRQVLIESRMVTVRDNVDEQLGVRWGFSDQQNTDGVSGSLEGAGTIAGGTIPNLADRLNVNLPITNPAGRIGVQIARLMDGTILDLELSALESENKGEIIASPRITVANQHEAYIEQGTEIPYVQATSSGATSVEFKKAVLSLKVTPHITPDDRIILDLVVTQDTRGETVSTSTGPAVAIDTQEIKTQVLVENGETIVLGGIFQQTSTDDIAKVPLLGDLPILGNLFKNSQTIQEKRELLIFVTPKILTDAL